MSNNYRNKPRYKQNIQDASQSNGATKKALLIGLGAGGLVAALGVGGFLIFSGAPSIKVIGVSPAYQITQQPYQECQRVATTHYVKNKKNGTEGGVIGGTTGAVAGGLIGNSISGGGGGAAIGAVTGAAGGALIGRGVQRDNQPDYVARNGSTNKCHTAYKDVQTQQGYTVQYLLKDNVGMIVTTTAPAVGTKMPLTELQAMALPTQSNKLTSSQPAGN